MSMRKRVGPPFYRNLYKIFWSVHHDHIPRHQAIQCRVDDA
jgi:hypothetical protein